MDSVTVMGWLIYIGLALPMALACRRARTSGRLRMIAFIGLLAWAVTTLLLPVADALSLFDPYAMWLPLVGAVICSHACLMHGEERDPRLRALVTASDLSMLWVAGIVAVEGGAAPALATPRGFVALAVALVAPQEHPWLLDKVNGLAMAVRVCVGLTLLTVVLSRLLSRKPG